VLPIALGSTARIDRLGWRANHGDHAGDVEQGRDRYPTVTDFWPALRQLPSSAWHVGIRLFESIDQTAEQAHRQAPYRKGRPRERASSSSRSAGGEPTRRLARQ
jgi:hypothetical protein